MLAGPGTAYTAVDGRQQAPSDAAYHLLAASRPFLEARIRARVLALPNVSVLRARATGLEYGDGAVSAVRPAGDDDRTERILAADFVVDAMGRSSRAPDWLPEAGYDQPRLERLEAPINYATPSSNAPSSPPTWRWLAHWAASRPATPPTA